jgi:hypothetical protein
MALARTRLRITNMMFPLMGRFAHSERVYPSPEHQSNHVTALSAREDGGDASPMFLFAGAEVPVSGKIADRFTDGGENLPKERLAAFSDEKDGSGRKVLGRGQEGLQVAKVREHAGLRERSAVLTLINETLSRTVTPVKQFLGLLV